MKKKNFKPVFNFNAKITVGLLVCLCLFSTVVIKAQETEIEKLISEVSVDTQKDAILNYTYLMKVLFQRHKFGGRKFMRLYEAVLPSRYSSKKLLVHPLILIEDSERAITDDEIRTSRQVISNQIIKAESEKDEDLAEANKAPEDAGYWTINFSAGSSRVKIDILQFLKNAKWNNLQRTVINDRKIIIVEFTPSSTASFTDPLSYLSKIEGQVFIDEADKRVIAVEGYSVGEFAKLKEKPEQERRQEAAFLFLQTKVSEGFWFPEIVRLNFDKHPEIFEEIELEFSFKDYKKGAVDIEFLDKQQEDKEQKPPTTKP